jgi:hypothetical protein
MHDAADFPVRRACVGSEVFPGLQPVEKVAEFDPDRPLELPTALRLSALQGAKLSLFGSLVV